MTTQETINAINEKAAEVKQSAEALLNSPTRDAAIQIIVYSGRLQLMSSTAIESLRKIAISNQAASADELRLMAKAALSNLNEAIN